MLWWLFRLFKGYVRIHIKSISPEYFLERCRINGIFIWELVCLDKGQYQCCLFLKDVFCLKNCVRGAGVRLRICERRGLPFFLRRNQKRWYAAAGFFSFFLLLYIMSLFLWDIHFQGNYHYSADTLVRYLDMQNIKYGMKKKNVDCEALEAGMREAFPQITWVSARIEGTRLILNIQEGIIQKEINSNTSPCNLIADKDGVITDMIVRRGIPVKKPGDSCKKGELLVSGELHIMNDSQEVLRKEYVHADADIFISRQISYYQEFPLKYRTEIPAGKKKKEMYFRFGHWYLGLHPALHTGQKRITEEIPLRITENFILPVWIGWTETTDYTVKEETYTRKEAEKEAVRRFHQYEKKLLQNGIKISENHITTRLTESLCITGGTLLIIEQTGEKSRIT